MAKHAVQHDRLPGRDAAPPGSTEPTVLYVDGGVGFGGSSISLSLTLRAIHGVRKLLVTSQKQEIIDLLFSGIPAWRIRRWVNYRTRSTLSRMVRRLRVPVLSWVVSRTYSVLDMLVTGFNTLRLYRIIRKHGVDLVHVNNGYRPQEGVYAARLAGVP
ncbi:MAG TPA: hypothetical protein VK966_00490, partial [Longimicrobiales bacterium]|nr:hypothetical protein [Longimicrobiales bacterium]